MRIENGSAALEAMRESERRYREPDTLSQRDNTASRTDVHFARD
jgi:hypothetical protein